MNNRLDVVERHYWKAVAFLVILILVGTAFWGIRRFAPAIFLGEPDLIAVPNTEHTRRLTTKSSISNKPALLNLNTASAQELRTLPNIGERMAERIVDYRTEHGDFTSVDALQAVKGIGPKTIDQLRPFVDTQ